MKIGIISLFPEMFRAVTDYGVTSRAIKNGFLNIKIWNPRDFTHDRYRSIDNRPYGGGPGMLMMAQPLIDAIAYAKFSIGKNAKVIYMSPQGRLLDQANIVKISKNRKLILVCGRYEGVDERLIQTKIDEEWSVGNYILSGGELPAMMLIDSVIRLVPGVIGNKLSIEEDSFSDGLLKYPQYTRPITLEKITVPPVLLHGNHMKIRYWRIKQSLGRTWLKKPELLENLVLSKEKKLLLIEFILEFFQNLKKFKA